MTAATSTPTKVWSVVGRYLPAGEEIVFVMDGMLDYQGAGRERVTLHAGDVVVIPARAILGPAVPA